MEIRSLMENIVTETFNRDGESFDLKINIDVIMPEYYDVLAVKLEPLTERLASLRSELAATQEIEAETDTKPKRAKQRKQETKANGLAIEKQIAEIRREAFAERLTVPVTLSDGSHTQLLKDWSITENGSPIPPNKENLMRLPPRAVEEFWERSIERIGRSITQNNNAEQLETGLGNIHEVAMRGMAAIKR